MSSTYTGKLSDNKFWITKTSDSSHGRICNRILLDELIDVALELKVEPPENFIVERNIGSLYALYLTIIQGYSPILTLETIENLTESEFRRYFYTCLTCKQDLCDILQRWFESHNMIE